MSDDLRKQRSESVEGKGRARWKWESYAATRDGMPRWLHKVFMDVAFRWTEEMLGFWVCWHLYGGFEGLKRAGWNERTIYRRLKRFRLVFDQHPDEFELGGVDLDLEAFWGQHLPKPAAEK